MAQIDNKDYKHNYFHTLTDKDASPVVVHSETGQITVVVSGKGFTEVNGISYEIQEGSIVLVDAMKKHKFWCEKDSIVLFHIHAPYETMFSDRIVIEGQDFEVH